MSKGSINLSRGVRAHSNVKLRAVGNGQISIGEKTSFNYGCMVVALHKIRIEAGVEFGPNVLIYDHDHDFDVPDGIKANKFKTGEVSIGENTWVGAQTVILRGTTIGKNSVVGAGSVLSGTFPPNSIIVQKRDTVVRSRHAF